MPKRTSWSYEEEPPPQLFLVERSEQSRPAPIRRPLRPSLLIYWHLLSLDAPSVACLWTAFIAWSMQVTLPRAELPAMFVAVWILYATDRLLDARPLRAGAQQRANDLEQRHLFHDQHRRILAPVLAFAALTLAVLLCYLSAPILHLYVILGCCMVFWLAWVHVASASQVSERPLHKELAVGIFFAAATHVPVWAHAAISRFEVFFSAILFGVLCTLNCVYLYAWEHPLHGRPPRRATRWSLPRLRALTTGYLLACALSAAAALRFHAGHHELWRPTPDVTIPLCCALSASALFLLHRNRKTIAPLRLRAFADFVLLTPAFVLLASGVYHGLVR